MSYLITAAGVLDAADDHECQTKLEGLAKLLADADGEYGSNWTIEAERTQPGDQRNEEIVQ